MRSLMLSSGKIVHDYHLFDLRHADELLLERNNQPHMYFQSIVVQLNLFKCCS